MGATIARFTGMAKDEKPTDLIGYEALHEAALRGVIRAALEHAAGPRGLPGDHHFYISFRTTAPDVAIPAELRGRYPDEMTIVLQNQYWDLSVGETAFSVTLQFAGQPKSLSIPYAAVTRFYDPSVQHLLQFNVAAGSEPAPPPAAAPVEAPGEAGAEVKVVSLDQFRKK
jgi:hypothetical protein